ncbi:MULTISPECIES: alginate O-acetyltransferase AlgF [unclassified Pseudomonas]|uniref:alginate O-acetyltransferase AlgF n=1 Tax=unclassified Pseudomonas TaxID=196821 RepID=UPI000BD09E22|nr:MULTISPECIES: alginate O-acetyltransferase AlgF [unclassified Pseudomonas]PVZ12402.1 alginate O-acetyltransferase complex protein AlgF [Pseudomonas sp. URIL14HWK12:I12]PVZ23446.1 alginate O-acetyltransferase complex protein AlgF [Pseudomonas sp. URIL14HWK12:I10]PVZ32776.1 alginate O-acetyltransferase complex protein AlgF [Pseudomonas sp. URIL14HWK12:I11]SNZ14054.1 alginate O-acetyltransferase complex protein AlgF [Pseudomonas sp. URIL14HWK12:I9]
MYALATAPRRIVKNRAAKLCALAAGLSMLSLNAFAGGDSALYPTAPAGSAFVRVYNASSQEVTPSIGTAKFTPIAPQKSSAYSFLPGGSYTAQLGGTSLPVKLDSNKYYTVVNETSAAKLVEESKFDNKQKARVDVQNLTDKPLTLKTADGKTAVVEDVAPGKSGQREINPVKVSLALFSGATKVADVKPVSLERGQITSLFVTGSGSNVKAEWVVPPAS